MADAKGTLCKMRLRLENLREFLRFFDKCRNNNNYKCMQMQSYQKRILIENFKRKLSLQTYTL